MNILEHASWCSLTSLYLRIELLNHTLVWTSLTSLYFIKLFGVFPCSVKFLFMSFAHFLLSCLSCSCWLVRDFSRSAYTCCVHTWLVVYYTRQHIQRHTSSSLIHFIKLYASVQAGILLKQWGRVHSSKIPHEYA